MKNYILAGIVILAIIVLAGIFLLGIIVSSEYTDSSEYGNNSPYINETGKLNSFNQIIVTGKNPCLIITQGDKESLLVDYFGKNETSNVVKVSKGKLYLNSTEAIYHLTVKNINSVKMTASGTGQVQSMNLKLNKLTINITHGELNDMYNSTINDLTINLNGGAPYVNAITNLTVKNLNINLNNSGKLFVDGNASNQIINVYGDGNYTATNLTSEKATIYVNGPGYAVVRVSNLLNAIIKGKGQINYIGNPQIIRKITGGGTVTIFPLKAPSYINS